MLPTLGVAILLLLEGPLSEPIQLPKPIQSLQEPAKAQPPVLIRPRVKPESAPQLDQDALEEIKKIRERIGIRLFSGSQNQQEFESQLRRVGEQRFARKTEASPEIRIKPTQPVRAPRVEPGPRDPFSRFPATVRSLFSAVESLDREALQLEKTGQFEKSKKLRKLSRRIQKQIQQMVNP
ncbi:MAG: hypothetical protein VX438_05500 [Planctomycetota bacterium]|jgi:hypothetical protein|nr:hypothetical protein [Planctomycetota bacterium]